MTYKYLLFFAFSNLIFSCKGPSEKVDVIYHGGTIITMENETIVEAVAVADGKISDVGSLDELKTMASGETKMIDLKGRTMTPGFVDAHSHFSMAMRLARSADLSPPPVGHVNSIGSLLTTLDSHKKNFDIPEGDWIVGWGYDQDQFTELRHPNRYDLDEVFPNNPVFLLHISGHMAVGNTVALDMVGINAETPDPQGGVIVKMSNSENPSGLLLETASMALRDALPQSELKELQFLVQEVQDYYASHGITTAQDGILSPKEFEFLESVARADGLKLDIEVLGSFQQAEQWLTEYKERFGESNNGLRLSGLKIVSDGSPQGKTAFFSEPYHTEVPGCAHNCTGVPVVNQDQLDQLLMGTYASGIQTFVHCNGDGSIDMLLNAHDKAISAWQTEDDPRTVVIHSQFVRPDQLDKYVEYGFVPSFFTNHAYFWGDVHMDNLGEARASFLSPLKTATAKGITATNHTDYIVTPLNQLFLMWTAVNRTSRSGRIIGPDERITAYEALKAITINSAYQHKVENKKGSIKIGKMADFVILDRNPLEVSPEEIKDIQVMETIKEGEVIFENSESN